MVLMRSNSWLEKQLDFLLKKYFSNVKITNPIEIKFGREAKYRFGSIKLYKESKRQRVRGFRKKFSVLSTQFSVLNAPRKSIITITSMFAKESVPVGVVRYTI